MRTIDHRTYQQLKLCFGQWASWALWNHADISDLAIMEPRGIPHPLMRADLVFVGLNAALPTSKPWEAFHTMSAHDTRLALLLNNTVFGGAYLTDIIKSLVEVNGKTAADVVKNDKTLLDSNAKLFCEELAMLGAGADTTIIVFGNEAWDIIQLMMEKGLLTCGASKGLFVKNTHFAAYVSIKDMEKELARHSGRIIPEVSYSEEV
jgi:hypothetical protein